MTFVVDRGLYPFESHFFTLPSGVRMHYLDEGDGPPVVMVHGNPSWSFYFRALVQAMRGAYRVIVPDHIGCGLSEKPDDRRYRHTLEQRIDDLEALLGHLGLTKEITLIAHDWGGMIGMGYVVRDPSRIKRIALMNTSAFLLPAMKPFPWELRLTRTPLGALLVRGLNAFARGAVARCVAKKPMDADVSAMYLGPYGSWGERRGILRFVQDIPLYPSDPAYPIVKHVEDTLPRLAHLPLLICWGSRDFIFDDVFLSAWREKAPHAEILRFPDAGHYVLEDEPDAICAAIQSFCQHDTLHLTQPPKYPIAAGSSLEHRNIEAAEPSPKHRNIEFSGLLPKHRNTEAAEPSPKHRNTEAAGLLLEHRNIAAALVQIAKEHPDLLAVAMPQGREADGSIRYARWSYAELDAISDQQARGLRRLGFQPGMRTVLMVPPSLEFFSLVFAMFKAGLVPVVVDPGMGLRSLKACLGDARPEGFIGIPKAHAARIALGWAKETIHHFVHVGRRVGRMGATLDEVMLAGEGGGPMLHAPASFETAAILFTSGSTGIPKGAVYAHSHFQAQIKTIRETYHIQPGERDLCTFPLFALFAPALGMSAYIPEMDASRPVKADARKIIQAIQEQAITNLFGSPALLRVLARYAQSHPVQLPTLRRVISAGAPMPPSLLVALQPMLTQGVEIFPGYGATEAMPLCTLGSQTTLQETRFATDQGKGVCVGHPCTDVTLRIIAIRDEAIPMWSSDLVLPTGQIGEIAVKGPMVTHAYLHNEKGTALAKIHEGADIWHRMGDLGWLDEQGRVWFCGRKSQRLETAKGPMFTVPCESIFQTHPKVHRAALVGLAARPNQTPAICIEPLDPKDALGERWKALESELRSLAQSHDITRPIVHFLPHRAFPVDVRHNSKIFHEKLTTWAHTLLGPWVG